ncbi:MAG TPA: hypothetical protein VNF29_02315, partial [Candidatus Binataceae bacterium]|nr:hypothetical protein [Candidatus Binataceae bacterium]
MAGRIIFHRVAMAKARKSSKPRKFFVPVVPQGAGWIESDRYDRRAWNEIAAGTPAFADLSQAASALVPHFDALLADFFFALFKFNLVWNKPAAVRRAAALNRAILDEILPSPAFAALKHRTLLEED